MMVHLWLKHFELFWIEPCKAGMSLNTEIRSQGRFVALFYKAYQNYVCWFFVCRRMHREFLPTHRDWIISQDLQEKGESWSLLFSMIYIYSTRKSCIIHCFFYLNFQDIQHRKQVANWHNQKLLLKDLYREPNSFRFCSLFKPQIIRALEIFLELIF